jgi:hypothetical protein
MLVASLSIYALAGFGILLLIVSLTSFGTRKSKGSHSTLFTSEANNNNNNDDDDDLIHFDLSSISVRSFGESHTIELRLATDLELDNDD